MRAVAKPDEPESFSIRSSRDRDGEPGFFIVDGFGDPIYPDNLYLSATDAKAALDAMVLDDRVRRVVEGQS